MVPQKPPTEEHFETEVFFGSRAQVEPMDMEISTKGGSWTKRVQKKGMTLKRYKPIIVIAVRQSARVVKIRFQKTQLETDISLGNIEEEIEETLEATKLEEILRASQVRLTTRPLQIKFYFKNTLWRLRTQSRGKLIITSGA